MNLDDLIEEIKKFDKSAELLTVHKSETSKHLWVVRVRRENSYIVWSWNTESKGLFSGVYDLDFESSLNEFMNTVKFYEFVKLHKAALRR